ncbi:heme peroxidase [Crucibulum laeve]|uniref:Heme peroxidase n=1 Tax=Crucibulum laeve TaxID=68775 RepID=A0A5C3LYS5_9AGAR|nr:heme peroxidase [Crucibulum laeve]
MLKNFNLAGFATAIAQALDYADESNAPLNRDGARPKGAERTEKVQDLQALIRKPAFELTDLPVYYDAIKDMASVGLDDRELLLEKVLVLMSRTAKDPMSMKIQQSVINLLYNDLPHPPSGYLCLPPATTTTRAAKNPSVKYAFRTADGSNYNPLFPTMGMAGSPYARSVPSSSVAPPSALPDPGLVFDTLLRREKDTFTEHPGGISSLFFAFADLVIHSIFDTNHSDWTINNTSSYLDLSILYGNSEKQLDSIRRKDGTGKLWDDVFADNRLLFMPPASCAILVLLSRNHNYIAEKLLNINERGTFSNPLEEDWQARKAQDDEIFERTRLINCGYFMQIILGDYVGAILGLVLDQSTWRLDPLMVMRELSHEIAPRGEGNVVSLEFNLLYRWHATLSKEDATWTKDLFDKLFDKQDPNTITIQDFKRAAHKYMIPTTSVKEWTFANLKRGPDGRFNDDDLARILHNATETRAGAFQARGTPEVLRIIEIMGIEQSRTWATCSMNEFRKFLGLKPYKSFKEWNSDEKIHTAAAALYRDIDNLELHVGLQAEEAKKPGPGAGLCPGYTISRAILADAVCLTRGDRFLTTEFTPYNLTSWGWQDCQYDKEDGSYGGLLTKLLFRTLPEHYPAGSAYAHFPFLDPKFMKANLDENDPATAAKYTWSRPISRSPTTPVEQYSAVKQVLSDRNFMSSYDERLFKVVQPVATPKLTQAALTEGRSVVANQILTNAKLGEYFAAETLNLIKSKTVTHADKTVKYLDIVKDVINLIPIRWICEEVAGLPLKTTTNPKGRWYEDDACARFSEIARYVYLNLDPVHDWRLRESAQKTASGVIDIITAHLDHDDSILKWFTADNHNHGMIESRNCHIFLEKVEKSLGKSQVNADVAAKVFTATVPSAALYSQAVAHIVDFYLSEDKQSVREEIVKLSASKDKDASSKIMTYAREALRLKPVVPGVYRTAGQDVILGPLHITSGEHVYASLVEANLDTNVFGADPTAVKYNRSADTTAITEFGAQGLLDSKFFEATVPAVLGSIFGLRNIRRGPGKSGVLTSFQESWHGSPRTQYISTSGAVTPWADSLIIQYSN